MDADTKLNDAPVDRWCPQTPKSAEPPEQEIDDPSSQKAPTAPAETPPWVRLHLTDSWVEQAVRGAGTGENPPDRPQEVQLVAQEDLPPADQLSSSILSSGSDEDETLTAAASLICSQVRILGGQLLLLGGALSKLSTKSLRSGFGCWRAATVSSFKLRQLLHLSTRRLQRTGLSSWRNHFRQTRALSAAALSAAALSASKTAPTKPVENAKKAKKKSKKSKKARSRERVANERVPAPLAELPVALSGPEQQALEEARQRLKQLKQRRLAVALRAKSAGIPGHTMARLQQAALEAEVECAALVVALQEAATEAAVWEEEMRAEEAEAAVEEQALVEHEAAMGALLAENESIRALISELERADLLERAARATDTPEPGTDTTERPHLKQGWADEVWRLHVDLSHEARSLTKQLRDGARQLKFGSRTTINVQHVKAQLRRVRRLQRQAPFKFVESADWWREEVAGKWLLVDCVALRTSSVAAMVELVNTAAILSDTIQAVELMGVVIDMFDSARMGEEQLAAIVSAMAPIKRVSHVNLSDCEMGPNCGFQLAQLLHKCTSVDLSLNPLRSAGVIQMMHSAPVGVIQLLNLSDVQMESDGAEALAAGCANGSFHELCDLSIGSNTIGDDATTHLVNALHSCKQLEYLDLREVSCTGYGDTVGAVCKLIRKLPRLSCVRLCKNSILAEGALTINEQLLSHQRPVLLTLNNAMIDEAGAKELLHLVRKNQNISLSVKENPMGTTKLNLIEERAQQPDKQRLLKPTNSHWSKRVLCGSARNTASDADAVGEPRTPPHSTHVPLDTTSLNVALGSPRRSVCVDTVPAEGLRSPRSSPAVVMQMSPQAPPSPFLDAVWDGMDEQQKIESLCLNDHLIRANWILFCKRAMCLFASRASILKIRFLRRFLRKNIARKRARIVKPAEDECVPLFAMVPKIRFEQPAFGTRTFCAANSLTSLYESLNVTGSKRLIPAVAPSAVASQVLLPAKSCDEPLQYTTPSSAGTADHSLYRYLAAANAGQPEQPNSKQPELRSKSNSENIHQSLEQNCPSAGNSPSLVKGAEQTAEHDEQTVKPAAVADPPASQQPAAQLAVQLNGCSCDLPAWLCVCDTDNTSCEPRSRSNSLGRDWVRERAALLAVIQHKVQEVAELISELEVERSENRSLEAEMERLELENTEETEEGSVEALSTSSHNLAAQASEGKPVKLVQGIKDEAAEQAKQIFLHALQMNYPRTPDPSRMSPDQFRYDNELEDSDDDGDGEGRSMVAEENKDASSGGANEAKPKEIFLHALQLNYPGCLPDLSDLSAELRGDLSEVDSVNDSASDDHRSVSEEATTVGYDYDERVSEIGSEGDHKSKGGAKRGDECVCDFPAWMCVCDAMAMCEETAIEGEQSLNREAVALSLNQESPCFELKDQASDAVKQAPSPELHAQEKAKQDEDARWREREERAKLRAFERAKEAIDTLALPKVPDKAPKVPDKAPKVEELTRWQVSPEEAAKRLNKEVMWREREERAKRKAWEIKDQNGMSLIDSWLTGPVPASRCCSSTPKTKETADGKAFIETWPSVEQQAAALPIKRRCVSTPRKEAGEGRGRDRERMADKPAPVYRRALSHDAPRHQEAEEAKWREREERAKLAARSRAHQNEDQNRAAVQKTVQPFLIKSRDYGAEEAKWRERETRAKQKAYEKKQLRDQAWRASSSGCVVPPAGPLSSPLELTGRRSISTGPDHRSEGAPRGRVREMNVTPARRIEKSRRVKRLGHVFELLDLGGSGVIDGSVLLVLGKAKGEFVTWPAERNSTLIRKILRGSDGTVGVIRFAIYYEEGMPQDAGEFDAIVVTFLALARAHRESCLIGKDSQDSEDQEVQWMRRVALLARKSDDAGTHSELRAPRSQSAHRPSRY